MSTGASSRQSSRKFSTFAIVVPMVGRRCLFLLLILPFAAGGEPLTVAVASNFQTTAQELGKAFERGTGRAVRISAGSTGKLYGQIVNGAPFDVFLAADVERPARLERTGDAVPATRITYAIGSLVLWSRDAALAGANCRNELENLAGAKLAIANPETAPYGRAAIEFLEAAKLLETVRPSLVIGENISQTLHFVATGNARLGFVAASQIARPELPRSTCAWTVPDDMHRPIAQQAVLLQRSVNRDAGQQFLEFLVSERARSIIVAAGYRVPEAKR